MATEEETNESAVKAASEKNEGATITGKTVNNSVIDSEHNEEIDEAPLPQFSIGSGTVNSENPLEDNQYFFEDQVFFIDKAGRVKFGLIIETCDSYSGDEDDEDEEEKLGRGDVRVAWYPHGREHVRSENTIGLADRTLMPGDVVRRMAADCSPQRGYVRDIKITADVKVLGLPYVIKNVAAERLRPLSIWQRDCTVCLDSWVGSAKDVDERAVLKGVNGVRFEVQSADFYHFKEAATSRRPSVFSPLIFFPGNIVIGRLPTIEKAKVLTPDIPLPLNRKGVMLKGKFVVESVRTEGVIVQWQCKALSKGSSKKISELEPPKPYINADQLSRVKRLNVFESCVLQIADRSYLTYEPKDKLMYKSKWERDLATRFKEIFQQQRKNVKPPKLVAKITKLPPTENAKIEKTTTVETAKSGVEKNTSNAVDGDWLDTTTTATTDTSDLSDVESECTGTNEEIIERNELEPTTTTRAVENTVGSSHESAGATVKKSTANKNIVKKSMASRNKHAATHSRSQSHSSKWQHKNSFPMPLSNMCSVPEGKEFITETLLVYSTVSVVWQDGTVEHDIPSTQLYPIHHLDNHEFFPGDFTMLSREDPNITFRDYGVIQTVDHQGRTARVKWFKTYTAEDGPNFMPTYKGESEVSVYDLKDHPDFTYRPGGMVIRVSNFIGEDASCTAGQVLDNCIDGRVKVAWVDGHTSSCWPQDLFDVGHHEQNDYGGDSDSWETQSENSGPGGDYEDEDFENHDVPCAESDIVVNVERTRSAIARLEDILKASPHLQSRNVMRKLLSIYKTGRYIDRLMQTSFFHENHFLGLIERIIQEEPKSSDSQTSQDIILNATENAPTSQTNKVQKDELKLSLETIQKNVKRNDTTMDDSTQVAACGSPNLDHSVEVEMKPADKSSPETNNFSSSFLSDSNTPKVLLNVGLRITTNSSNISGSGGNKNSSNGNSSTTPTRHLRSCTYTTHVLHVRNDANYAQICGPDAPKSLYSVLPASELEKLTEDEKLPNKDNTETPSHQSSTLPSGSQFDNFSAEKNHLLSSALLSIEKAYQVTNSIKNNVEALLSQDDSGTFSRNNSDASNIAVEPESPIEETTTKIVSKKRKSSSDFDVICHIEFSDQLPSRLVCVPFCTMLKEQLQKCKDEIERQSTRFTTYKSLVVPTNINKTIGEHNEALVILSDGEGQLESTIISSCNESKEDEKSKPVTLKLDASNDLSTETWIVPDECFKILPNAPKNHKFYTSACEPSQPQQYFRAVQREHRLLKTSLPKGIWLRFYEDRIDLLSVMMEGPKKTPYENGLYFFDMQLGRDYPKRPPVCYYISYCVDRLNPNLYEEGKVCVSLLGTWSGRDVEVWGPNSTLLQVLVSIQGLILVPEPYFNEAGYEKQKGSLQGLENSRMYNEMVVIKVTQATMKMLANPPSIFLEEILEYYRQNGLQMFDRIRGWMELSKQQMQETISKGLKKGDIEETSVAEILAISEFVKPDFPLLPASRGFCLTLEGLLKNFKEKMEKVLETKNDCSVTTINKLPTTNAPPECGVKNLIEESNQS